LSLTGKHCHFPGAVRRKTDSLTAAIQRIPRLREGGTVVFVVFFGDIYARVRRRLHLVGVASLRPDYSAGRLNIRFDGSTITAAVTARDR
jgi:hypothetical protein